MKRLSYVTSHLAAAAILWRHNSGADQRALSFPLLTSWVGLMSQAAHAFVRPQATHACAMSQAAPMCVTWQMNETMHTWDWNEGRCQYIRKGAGADARGLLRQFCKDLYFSFGLALLILIIIKIIIVTKQCENNFIYALFTLYFSTWNDK